MPYIFLPNQVGWGRHLDCSESLPPVRLEAAQDGPQTRFKWQCGRAPQFLTGVKSSHWNFERSKFFFQVLFCSRSLDISQAERIHLSNLALLAYCQQTLTKPALSRSFCFFKIYHFAYLCVPGTTLMPAFCHSSLKMSGELYSPGSDCFKAIYFYGHLIC